jgi:hypothetical protein
VELKFEAKIPKGKGKGLPREMFMNWGGWFPHPELDKGIEPHPWAITETEQQTFSHLPVPPATVRYSVPSGINLGTFKKYRVEWAEAPSIAVDVQASAVLSTDGKQLATKKPVDGIHAFVWRVARYSAGLDRHIPVTAFWDLEDGIFKLTGTRGVSKGTVKFLEQRAGELVEAIGGNRFTASIRWARFLGKMV